MNGKLNRGLKSFEGVISYFIPGSKGNGMTSDKHMNRRIVSQMRKHVAGVGNSSSKICPF